MSPSPPPHPSVPQKTKKKSKSKSGGSEPRDAFKPKKKSTKSAKQPHAKASKPKAKAPKPTKESSDAPPLPKGNYGPSATRESSDAPPLPRGNYGPAATRESSDAPPLPKGNYGPAARKGLIRRADLDQDVGQFPGDDDESKDAGTGRLGHGPPFSFNINGAGDSQKPDAISNNGRFFGPGAAFNISAQLEANALNKNESNQENRMLGGPSFPFNNAFNPPFNHSLFGAGNNHVSNLFGPGASLPFGNAGSNLRNNPDVARLLGHGSSFNFSASGVGINNSLPFGAPGMMGIDKAKGNIGVDVDMDNNEDQSRHETNDVPTLPAMGLANSQPNVLANSHTNAGMEVDSRPHEESEEESDSDNDDQDKDKDLSPDVHTSKEDPILSSEIDDSQEAWNEMLFRLLVFKSQRGDYNVGSNEPAHKELFDWIANQRRQYKIYQDEEQSNKPTTLTPERISVLNIIDFHWNIRGDTFWQQNYDALVAYKNEHGDAKVPRLYAKNPKLGEWVTDQRKQWKDKCNGKASLMTDERKRKLDALGFIWRVRDRTDWNERFEQLSEFKKENGHCIVPQHYARNRALGKWVAKQREQYRFFQEGRHSFLSTERIELLKGINFTWVIKGRGAKKLRAEAKAQEDKLAKQKGQETGDDGDNDDEEGENEEAGEEGGEDYVKEEEGGGEIEDSEEEEEEEEGQDDTKPSANSPAPAESTGAASSASSANGSEPPLPPGPSAPLANIMTQFPQQKMEELTRKRMEELSGPSPVAMNHDLLSFQQQRLLQEHQLLQRHNPSLGPQFTMNQHHSVLLNEFEHSLQRQAATMATMDDRLSLPLQQQQHLQRQHLQHPSAGAPSVASLASSASNAANRESMLQATGGSISDIASALVMRPHFNGNSLASAVEEMCDGGMRLPLNLNLGDFSNNKGDKKGVKKGAVDHNTGLL